MEDGFMLPVPYKGETLELDAKFVRLGFIYQFHISIDGRTLIFERDEEQEYRVIDTAAQGRETDHGLMEAIVGTLKAL
ncbi:MAG: hypothetical protein ABW019_00015 [Chitinophagaceae bacterium]